MEKQVESLNERRESLFHDLPEINEELLSPILELDLDVFIDTVELDIADYDDDIPEKSVFLKDVDPREAELDLEGFRTMVERIVTTLMYAEKYQRTFLEVYSKLHIATLYRSDEVHIKTSAMSDIRDFNKILATIDLSSLEDLQ